MDKLVRTGSSPSPTREYAGEDVHPQDKLSHYSRGTTDITSSSHSANKSYGNRMPGRFRPVPAPETPWEINGDFDESSKSKYIPHVIEPALGVDRLLLAVLTAAFTEDEVGGEKRSLMKFHPRIAPTK